MTTSTNTKNYKDTKVTLAHDSFTQYGGAERVFEGIAETYPQAEIFTLAYEDEVLKQTKLAPSRLRISWLQSLYQLTDSFQWLFPLIPFVLATSKFSKIDVVLSASSSFIKGVNAKPALHINYCHTPTRFLWVDPEHAYKEIPKYLHWLAKPAFELLRRWDLRVANKVDYFIANSKEVQHRIQKFYNRDSEIIYPFVDTNFWKPTGEKKDFFLIAGRLQYAKGLDVVIKTCSELNLPLHVVGTGRYENDLKKLAGSSVKFLGRVSDERLREEYSEARAFIYPQIEDFGLMPIEAAACGTATIAQAKGGSLETVIPNETGVLLPNVEQSTLAETLSNWDNQKYQVDALTAHASKFSKERFQRQLSDFVISKYDEHFNRS